MRLLTQSEIELVLFSCVNRELFRIRSGFPSRILASFDWSSLQVIHQLNWLFLVVANHSGKHAEWQLYADTVDVLMGNHRLHRVFESMLKRQLLTRQNK